MKRKSPVSKKEMAITFLKMVVAKNIRAAYEKFIAPDFIHHNQYFKGDRQSLMLAMEEAHRKHPDTSIDIKRVFEEGDCVMTHSHVKHSPQELGVTVVHIFRFKNDRVVELWDLGQPLLKDSPNEHGAF